MAFNWARAVAKNRDDLFEVVTRLFVLAGIRTGRSVIMLPRGLRIRILAALRPAEFAVRRLILMAACGLVAVRPASPLRGGRRVAREARQSRVGVETTDRGDLLPPPGSSAPSASRPPCLSDLPARVRLNARGETSRPPAATPPRTAIPAFALFDPFKPFGHPWLEEGDNAEPDGPVREFDPGEPVDARGVCRRIVALEAALQDIDRHARRLARWRARRFAREAVGPRPRRLGVLRPGRPPGWRKHPKTPVETVLKECHGLALFAWNGPDTS